MFVCGERSHYGAQPGLELIVLLSRPPDPDITGPVQYPQAYTAFATPTDHPEERFRQPREKSSLRERNPGLSSSGRSLSQWVTYTDTAPRPLCPEWVAD